MSLHLKGESLFPEVEVLPEGDCVHMGRLKVGETGSNDFTIVNKGGFTLGFDILTMKQGQLNHCGSPAFTFYPSSGQLQPHQKRKIRVEFQPQTESEHFFEFVKIDIPNQKHKRTLLITGSAYSRNFYLTNPFAFSSEKFETFLEIMKTGNLFDFFRSKRN